MEAAPAWQWCGRGGSLVATEWQLGAVVGSMVALAEAWWQWRQLGGVGRGGRRITAAAWCGGGGDGSSLAAGAAWRWQRCWQCQCNGNDRSSNSLAAARRQRHFDSGAVVAAAWRRWQLQLRVVPMEITFMDLEDKH
jgi:hypothetical protein